MAIAALAVTPGSCPFGADDAGGQNHLYGAAKRAIGRREGHQILGGLTLRFSYDPPARGPGAQLVEIRQRNVLVEYADDRSLVIIPFAAPAAPCASGGRSLGESAVRTCEAPSVENRSFFRHDQQGGVGLALNGSKVSFKGVGKAECPASVLEPFSVHSDT